MKLVLAAAYTLLTTVPVLATDGEAHAKRAAELHREKNYSKAVDSVNAALEAGYKNHDIYILGGDCLMRLNDYKAAHAAFDAAVKFNTSSRLALRGRLTAALRIGNAKSAIDASGALINLGENEYLRRGKAYSLDRYDFLAISNFQEAMRRSKPDSHDRLDAFFERGESLLKLNLFDLALADFDRAAKLKELPTIERLRGRALSGMEKSEQAIAAFTKSLELAPHQNVYLLRAREYVFLRQWDKAIADNQSAAALVPNDEETQRNTKGNIASLKKDAADPARQKPPTLPTDPHAEAMKKLRFDEKPEEAKKLIDVALKETPNSVSALHALHHYHQSTGDHQAAFKAIAAASKIDRDNIEMLKDFATAAENIDKVTYALQAISRAISLGDESLRPLRAELFFSTGMSGAALTDIDQALKTDPKNARLHYLRSVSLLEQPTDIATPNQADAAFRKALELGYKGQRISRAQVLDAVGRPGDAIDAYTYDIENGHAYPGTHLRRAWAYEEIGKIDEAKADLEAAVKKAEPGSNTARAALESVERLKKR